jgi:Outer membrane lipoprotein LolB
MLKKVFILIGIVLCISCQPHRPGLQPTGGPHFQSLSIKFSFHDTATRQNGRIIWRFDDRQAKFIFFTPLNQVGLELDAIGENATLVNFSKKAFWLGDFAVLLDRLWGIELGLEPLKALVAKGIVPRAEFAAQGIEVQLEKNAGTAAPEMIRLRRGTTDLTLRIYKNDLRPGNIVLIDYSDRYQAADLETILDDD